MDGLYHCTTYDSLVAILKSQAFYPSYCLEESSYLRGNPQFAFAMVSFADLRKEEIKGHMKNFSSDVYIKMSKQWAQRHNVSPVVYYSEKSTLSNAIFRRMASQVAEMDQNADLYKSFNLFMGLLKQYKGHYFDKKHNTISKNEVCFYLEREWRYLPITQSGEAYFITEEEFYDEKFRKQKRDELIDHGYVLKFAWDDILEIGAGIKHAAYIVNGLSTICGLSKFEVALKLRVIFSS